VFGGVWRYLSASLFPNEKSPKNLITTRKHCVYKAFGAYKTNYEIWTENFAYLPICFANFPFFMSRPHIPGTMYFTDFAVIFDCSKPAAFQPYPPNFILGENSFCFLKFPISDFSNLGDSHFPFGG